jgi:hypothetical protein
MNKENYKSMGLYINWERGSWRMSYDEQKKLIEDIKNSKWEIMQRDFSGLDEVLKKWVEEISSYITVSDFVEEVSQEEKKNFNNNEEINIEDLPF